MGAEPRAVLLSLALPGGMARRRARRHARRLSGPRARAPRGADRRKHHAHAGPARHQRDGHRHGAAATGADPRRRPARRRDLRHRRGGRCRRRAGDAARVGRRRHGRVGVRPALPPPRTSCARRPPAVASWSCVELRGPQRRPRGRTAPARAGVGRRRRGRDGGAADFGRGAGLARRGRHATRWRPPSAAETTTSCSSRSGPAIAAGCGGPGAASAICR